MTILSEKLKIVRKDAGLTQAELAAKVGAYQTKYQNWESGQSEPDIETIKKLADALSVSLDWLLGRKGSMVREEQAVYVSSQALDPPSAKLLLIFKSLDAESKKAVLKYAEEKKILLKFSKGGK